MSTFVKPSEMTHSDFKNYIKDFESLYKSEIEVLENYERDDHLLSLPFCISYEHLLEDKLRYCQTCSEYYRAMADKSFWFMKRLVLRRAMKFEAIHYDIVGRLMQVRSYIKVFYGEGKGYTD